MKKEVTHNILRGLAMAAVVAAAVPMPDAVFAQNLSSSVTTIIGGIGSIPTIIAGVAYILGAILIVAGALKCRAHAENPTQTPMGHCLGRIGAGGAVIALPAIASWLTNTLSVGNGTVGFTDLGQISGGGPGSN